MTHVTLANDGSYLAVQASPAIGAIAAVGKVGGQDESIGFMPEREVKRGSDRGC